MQRDQIISYLNGENDNELMALAAKVKQKTVGDKVYLRGLIELSNRCRKNCLYCGIRAANINTERYELDLQTILSAAEYAFQSGFGSVVIQAGEQHSERFTTLVEQAVLGIKDLSKGALGVTLSLGEQSEQSYRRWFSAGAHRYLLRIESSNEELYQCIHPSDHLFSARIEALNTLRRVGYQVGSGVMIGLPGQTIEHLCDDLLFLQDFDIDMCGMGPYIEHPDAPLGESNYMLRERFDMALRMIALLRILMRDVNIASTTALHAIDPKGREMGIAAGANIIMPNITPADLRSNYRLYSNKPLNDINLDGFDVAYGQWGDSPHFTAKKRR